MGHEITNTDNVVLHRQAAWHGLGTIVEDAPTPRQALQIAGLDWRVEKWPIVAHGPNDDDPQHGGTTIEISNLMANIRTDTRAVLGTVGTRYEPIQNSDLADFCMLLAEQGDEVKIETAGSIRGGAKVWFLLKGESFETNRRRFHHNGDAMIPYILVSNGHDGGTALRCTPTTVRVVCSNTLHMVIPGWDVEAGISRAAAAGFVANHTGNVKQKVEQAKHALELYGRCRTATIGRIDALVGKDWNSEQVGRFLTQVYATTIEPIPTNPATAKEQEVADKATVAVRQMLKRFDLESEKIGPSAWCAYNAFSGWEQHDRDVRIRDAAKAAEARLQAKLFGDASDRAVKAFAIALSM